MSYGVYRNHRRVMTFDLRDDAVAYIREWTSKGHTDFDLMEDEC